MKIKKTLFILLLFLSSCTSDTGKTTDETSFETSIQIASTFEETTVLEDISFDNVKDFLDNKKYSKYYQSSYFQSIIDEKYLKFVEVIPSDDRSIVFNIYYTEDGSIYFKNNILNFKDSKFQDYESYEKSLLEKSIDDIKKYVKQEKIKLTNNYYDHNFNLIASYTADK